MKEIKLIHTIKINEDNEKDFRKLYEDGIEGNEIL
tara:strand:+ start:966 stop:1070 length:105 start_codon:yes stop_codon:yes gene_type:complete